MSHEGYVPGYGPGECPLIFVAEAPGESESKQLRPLVGRSGQYLDKAIREVTGGKYRLDDCYRTNVVKYRPPANKLHRLHEIGHTIEEGIPQLWQEIGDIQANCVVPLGNLALKAITGKGTGSAGILQWRGSILPTLHLNRKAVSTVHPAALLRAMGGTETSGSKGGLDARFQHIFRLDLERAFLEAETAKYDVPQPHLEVVRDHVNLERFFERYKDNSVLSVDIEVIRAIPICVGFAFNDWHGISVPLLDVMSWQNQDGIPSSELARLWAIIARVFQDPRYKIIGQNFKFDHQALHHICRMPISNFHADIMIMAHALYPEWEKKLAFHQSLWTRFPFHKDDGKQFNIKKDNIIKFLHYNARDCVVTYALYEAFIKQCDEIGIAQFPDWKNEFVLDYTMQLHSFYRRMENVGFIINKEKQNDLIARYVEKLQTIQVELDGTSGGYVNYNSPKQIKKLLFGKPTDENIREDKAFPHSFGLPERESTDEDSLVAIAANNCKRPEHKRFVELLLDYRRVRKALGTYFVAESDYDGRMRTSYSICGTETGRTSTRILKPPVRPKKIGLAFQTLTKHGEFGPEVREEFEADDGYSIVETDMSQAEARIVAGLGLDARTLELFARGEDIHSLTAKWIFNLSEEPAVIKHRYPDLRFIGKTTRHAGNYGMRDKRLMLIVNTDAKKFGINIAISQWRARQVLTAFHKYAPNIEGVFHEEVKKALRDNNLTLVNPFGRQRQFFDEWGESLWREAYAQIPQSTVPDALRKAGLRVEARIRAEGLYEKMTQFDSIFCIEAHDALYAMIRTEYVPYYVAMMHEEIERPIDFSRCTLPRDPITIPAESKVGRNLKECKVKGCKGCKYMHEYIPSKITVAA